VQDGPIFDLQEEYFEKILVDFQKCKKEIKDLDVDCFSRNVRFLCHFTTDAHTIGLIHSNFWGSRGNGRLDFFCELVPNKKKYDVVLTEYANKDHLLMIEQITLRTKVYSVYQEKVERWSFLLSKDFRAMARCAIKFGAEFAASWVYLAWKIA
jgi:hypothetical protein